MPGQVAFTAKNDPKRRVLLEFHEPHHEHRLGKIKHAHAWLRGPLTTGVTALGWSKTQFRGADSGSKQPLAPRIVRWRQRKAKGIPRGQNACRCRPGPV